MIYRQDYNGSWIELKISNNRVSIYDDYNSYSCSFDLPYLADMVKQFKEWENKASEFDTRVFHSYGYIGNWIAPERAKCVVDMLKGTLVFKKKNKSQLKRMAISSIQKDLAILKALLESRT